MAKRFINNNKKICGILIESERNADQLEYTVESGSTIPYQKKNHGGERLVS